jgi:hypothetical protein
MASFVSCGLPAWSPTLSPHSPVPSPTLSAAPLHQTSSFGIFRSRVLSSAIVLMAATLAVTSAGSVDQAEQQWRQSAGTAAKLGAVATSTSTLRLDRLSPEAFGDWETSE